MNLKSLELSGFKSFAKKARLEFKTPVTAIVGPNGSGKSNVAEAFRFVLGEQRMTQMRGKRTEDLIWNGSPKTAKAQRARVALVFDNAPDHGKRLLDIDFDEVEFERAIYRDSSTEYKINGSSARLRDITELLAGAHIGASGHHIISQGETDLILNVNPRDRRVMIEDALGLKVYQYKKEESLRKLEAVEANKKEAESLRREIKPHLKFLHKQVERVQKTREMREELKALYVVYFATEDAFITAEEKKLTHDRSILEEREKENERKLKEAEVVLTTRAHKEEAQSTMHKAKERLEALLHEKDSLMRDLGRVEGSLEALQERTHRMRERAQHDEVVHISRLDFESFQAEINDILSGNTGALSAVQNLVKAVRDTLDRFVSRYMRGEVAPTEDLEKEEAQCREKKEELEEMLRDRDMLIDEARRVIRDLEQRVETERESLRGAERAIYELRTTKNEVSIERSQLDNKVLEHERAVRELAEERSVARMLIGTIEGGTVSGGRSEQAARRKDIERLKIRLEDSGGGSGEDIMKEYSDVSERDQFLEREIADLSASQESLTKLIGELDVRIREEFTKGIDLINKEFQEFFALMFGGGSASLQMVIEKRRRAREFDGVLNEEMSEADSGGEEKEHGVVVEVSLPRKKIRGLQMLSGGERALTSIALLFAMSQVNPPPFILLDETDAALDEANSRRYGDMIDVLAKRSQLILITHNRETMSRAGVLYGVTMGVDGSSQLLSVDFAEAVKVAK